jgi:hypothetical protein
VMHNGPARRLVGRNIRPEHGVVEIGATWGLSRSADVRPTPSAGQPGADAKV